MNSKKRITVLMISALFIIGSAVIVLGQHDRDGDQKRNDSKHDSQRDSKHESKVEGNDPHREHTQRGYEFKDGRYHKGGKAYHYKNKRYVEDREYNRNSRHDSKVERNDPHREHTQRGYEFRDGRYHKDGKAYHYKNGRYVEDREYNRRKHGR